MAGPGKDGKGSLTRRGEFEREPGLGRLKAPLKSAGAVDNGGMLRLAQAS